MPEILRDPRCGNVLERAQMSATFGSAMSEVWSRRCQRLSGLRCRRIWTEDVNDSRLVMSEIRSRRCQRPFGFEVSEGSGPEISTILRDRRRQRFGARGANDLLGLRCRGIWIGRAHESSRCQRFSGFWFQRL
jgi:hypothetical protein